MPVTRSRAGSVDKFLCRAEIIRQLDTACFCRNALKRLKARYYEFSTPSNIINHSDRHAFMCGQTQDGEMLRLAKDMQEFMYVLGVLPTNLFIVHFCATFETFLPSLSNQPAWSQLDLQCRNLNHALLMIIR